MIRTGLPGKPWGSAADACPISASAAMAATHANPPAADRPMPCAPSAILARRAHGAASAFTRVDAKENACSGQAAVAGQRRARKGGAGRDLGTEYPPTAAMSEATHGGAASPQDVQSQNRGGPTAAQQAEGARRPASERLASAQSALEQARNFDRSGQETQCMDAIARAKGSYTSAPIFASRRRMRRSNVGHQALEFHNRALVCTQTEA